MTRTMWQLLFIGATVISATGTARAVDPTISQNSAVGTAIRGNVSFPVSGNYNAGTFGPVGSVEISVKQTDADGMSNPVVVTFTTDLTPTNPNSGSYSKVCTVSYTQGKKYFVKVVLYDNNNPKQPLAATTYIQRSVNNDTSDDD